MAEIDLETEWYAHPDNPRYMVSEQGEVWDTKQMRIVKKPPGFAEHALKDTRITELRKKHKSSTGLGRRQILNLDTGRVYKSAAEAAYDLDVTRTSIYDCCRGKTKTAGGNALAYIGSDAKVIDPVEYRPRYRQAVRCIDTGEIYPTVAVAAEACGIDSSNLHKYLNGIGKSFGGYRWEYVDDKDASQVKKSKNE